MLGVNKEVLTFPKDIRPKVNIIAWLEFEPAYDDVAVQYACYYVTKIIIFMDTNSPFFY